MSIETKEWKLNINELNIGFFEKPLIKWSVYEVNRLINFDLENSAFIDKQKYDELVAAESTIAELQGRLSEHVKFKVKWLDCQADLDQLRAQLAEQPKPAESVQEMVVKLNHVLKMNAGVMTGTGVAYIEQVIASLESPKVEQVSGGDEPDWDLCESLTCNPDVHEAYIAFADDATKEQATILASVLIKAYINSQPSPNKADVKKCPCCHTTDVEISLICQNSSCKEYANGQSLYKGWDTTALPPLKDEG